MTRGGLKPAKPFFEGLRTLATVDALDAFVRRAAPEDRFTYCEDSALPADPCVRRAGELAQQGLVRTHQTKRAGGGFVYFVVRTGKGRGEPTDPVKAALADPATDLIFRALKRAANLGAPCPSDAELARLSGLLTRAQAQGRFRRLIDLRLIESTVAYEGGVPCRVVTIAAGAHAGGSAGKVTALPKKWAALQRAAERETREQAR